MIAGLQMVRSPQISFDELKREALREIHERMMSMPDIKPDDPFLEINISCGGHLVLNTVMDFLNLPEKDVPCQCGNTEHYLIKFGFIGE